MAGSVKLPLHTLSECPGACILVGLLGPASYGPLVLRCLGAARVPREGALLSVELAGGGAAGGAGGAEDAATAAITAVALRPGGVAELARRSSCRRRVVAVFWSRKFEMGFVGSFSSFCLAPGVGQDNGSPILSIKGPK